MPWPYDAVASLHFPHLNGRGSPTSSNSKFILSRRPSLFKKSLYFSTPTFWAIRTAPILDDLTKICSTLKFLGNLSCSDIVYLSQVKLLYKFFNIVFESITLFSNPAAIVKVLKTDPNS